MAHHIIDNEKCGKCGLPLWIAFSEDSRIGFEVDHHTCESCAVLETVTDKKDYKKKPGQTAYVKTVIEEIEGEEPFKATRKDFMEQQMDKAIREAEREAKKKLPQ